MLSRLVITALILFVATGCDRFGGGEEVVDAEEVGPATAEAPRDGDQPRVRVEESCETTPFGIVVCPDLDRLHHWGVANHTPEPDESTVTLSLTPPDPMPIRDGLVIYDDLLRGAARRTRAHLELWTHTPTYGREEVRTFAEDPELWGIVTDFRGGSTSKQIGMIRDRIRSGNVRELRAILFRNGIFYLENPEVARYAANSVQLKHVFEDEELELFRAGQRFALQRGERGEYLFVEPVINRATASLHLLDRIGRPGTLDPIPSYELQRLRREHGLSNIVVGVEAPSGRPVTVRFFDGESFDGVIVLNESSRPTLAVVGSVEEIRSVRERNLRDRTAICSLFEMTDLMVRERLPFDEPEVEYGQQDGFLRPRFQAAYRRGRTTYTMNGVTYDVFDRHGQPIVPQVCVDFLTDAVDRMHGNWWAPRDTSNDEAGALPTPSPKPDPAFDMRDYLPFRSVRSLLAIKESHPLVAEVDSLPREQQIPYKEGSSFFDNLWALRDQIREGDALIIYGLRADNRNHFHSVYVRETDPIYGSPTILTANPGFARIQDWHSVMWESPKRSIRHIFRWNPDWLRSPHAVDRATDVLSRARSIAEATE